MIQVLAGTVELHELITDYKINVFPVMSENNFTAFDGSEFCRIMGHKTKIQCTLKKVPHDTAQKIAEIVKRESFELTYTTPIEVTNKFRCTDYSAEPKCSDPRQKNPLITDKITWNISLTMESTDIAANVSDGL